MRRLFIWGSWVPPAFWGATLYSIRSAEGWGAWAAAPALILPVLLSTVWAVVGVVLVIVGLVQKRPVDPGEILATLVGGSAIGYYTIWNLFFRQTY